MIILDTHIWIWWVANQSKLSEKQLNYLKEYESEGLGISIISCWEIAKLAPEK